MRKLDSFIPEAAEADIFGQHAVALMKRTLEVGYDAAIAEELANPTWDDPDWCRMIVARSRGQAPRFSEDTSITFRCWRCKDTGFIERPTIVKHGTTYPVFAVCDPCAWRLWAKREWEEKQARERTGPGRARGRFQVPTGDDPF
jgi:hypothetical protein